MQQLMSKKSHERKQSQQGRRGAQNRQIRPLALRFDAQMRSHFMKRDLDRPTHDKPFQDLNWVNMLVGTQNGLRGETALWITNERPADRHRRDASMVPQGPACGDFHLSSDATIPAN